MKYKIYEYENREERRSWTFETKHDMEKKLHYLRNINKNTSIYYIKEVYK